MRLENSSSSPGESPHLGNPWNSLLKNSLPPEVVDRSEKSLRGKQSTASNQSSGFSWRQISFRKLSLSDRDGISPLLRRLKSKVNLRRYDRNNQNEKIRWRHHTNPYLASRSMLSSSYFSHPTAAPALLRVLKKSNRYSVILSEDLVHFVEVEDQISA